nr:unnamed protein product [Callosobruchus analis]
MSSVAKPLTVAKRSSSFTFAMSSSLSYYYYNNTTKKTQWEHPLDEVYRGLVKKARAESQSASIHDNRDDATCVTDDLLSLDEPPKLLDPFPIGTKRRDVRLSPLKLSPAASPKKESKLFKQMSEDVNLKSAKKLSLGFSSFDNEKDISFDKHPRSMDKPELKLTGGGSMFLKSNTKKATTLEQQSSLGVTSHMEKSDSFQGKIQQPKGILREKLAMEHSKSVEFDKLSTLDKSEKEDDDRKSVRFNLDNNTDIGITFSDKSSSEDDLNSNKNIKADEIINVKVTPNKSRFTVVPVSETNSSLKLIKPNPSDFVKPKLTLNAGSDSDEETRSLEKIAINNVDSIFDSDNSTSSHEEKLGPVTRSKLVNKSDKAVEKMKQKIWEEKNDELVKFKEGLETSHKSEIGRIVDSEKSKYEKPLRLN